MNWSNTCSAMMTPVELETINAKRKRTKKENNEGRIYDNSKNAYRFFSQKKKIETSGE